MKHVKSFTALFENESIHEQIFPSEEFGIATGMDWIYVKWKLPVDEKDPDKAADFFAAELMKLHNDMNWKNDLDTEKEKNAIKELSKFYSELIKLNPELNKKAKNGLTFDYAFDVCFGALSRFNLDDIMFYSNISIQEKLEYNRKNRETINSIEEKAESMIGWVMCPETIKRVKKELNME